MWKSIETAEKSDHPRDELLETYPDSVHPFSKSTQKDVKSVQIDVT
jgi:hypothetical protein